MSESYDLMISRMKKELDEGKYKYDGKWNMEEIMKSKLYDIINNDDLLNKTEVENIFADEDIIELIFLMIDSGKSIGFRAMINKLVRNKNASKLLNLEKKLTNVSEKRRKSLDDNHWYLKRKLEHEKII